MNGFVLTSCAMFLSATVAFGAYVTAGLEEFFCDGRSGSCDRSVKGHARGQQRAEREEAREGRDAKQHFWRG